MLNVFAKIIGLSLVFSLLTSCEDVSYFTEGPSKELVPINQVLKNWREGYQSEDLDMYMGAFWEDGFLYVSDMGTMDDKTDDVIFDDIRDERDAAKRVFASYQDIEIELSHPPGIQLNTDRTRAEVKNHYRIQGFVADGSSLEGGFLGWFAEGNNVFTLELRENKESNKQEWRITEWRDEAYSPEQIRAANNLP